jgi:hypothetical protein
VANIVRGSGEVPVRGQETEKPRLECRSAGRQRRFHRQHRRDRRRIEGFAAKDTIIRLINNPKNRGKGYSMRNGILQAAGEVVMFTDADLSLPIEEAELLFATIRDRGNIPSARAGSK